MLMVAAMQGRTGCLCALLEALGADPDVATVGKAETALHLAAFGGHYDCVGALLEIGRASTVLVNEYNETAEESALAARKPQSVRCAELIARYRAAREAGERGLPQPAPAPAPQ